MINEVVRRVVNLEEAFFERAIPGVGTPLVKVDEKVEPADIIARYEASSGQRLVKLTSVLKVHSKQVEKYLVKRIGDRIYRGEVLALRKGFLGMSKKMVVSPADGILDSLLPDGSVMIKFLPTPRKLAAAVSGVVKVVIPHSITIQTQVAKVYGFTGAGIIREGTLRVIAKPNEFILPSQITPNLQGEILVGGATIARATIEKAVTLGVKGIIVGGMNYRDFLSLGNESDVGITILITEGFGVKPMGTDVFNFLKNKSDSFAFISGREKQVTFPLVEKGQVEKKNFVPWRELKEGDRVNVLFHAHEIGLGIVNRINPGDNIPTAVVKLDSGTEIEVPSTNLQIVD
jgi:hypothetical protein